MRVGVEVSTSPVTSASTRVLFTFAVWTQNQYQYSDDQVLTYGGDAGGGTTSYNNSSGSAAVLRSTQTAYYNYTTSGSSPGNTSFSATVSGAYNGVTPSVLVTPIIPARPYALPAVPTGVSAVRGDDTQITLSWTPHATTAAPYTSQTVQMRTYAGAAWGAWVTVASASSGATSYTKTGLSSNHGYQFQVRSNNSAGSSAFVASGVVLMTPAAPAGVASAVVASGAQVTTTWTDPSYAYAPSPITFSVQRSVAGGAFSTVTTGIAQGTHTWTDPSPGAGTNQYQVAAVQATGALTSDFTLGNLVSTIVAPLSPTALSPNGTGADFSRALTLHWQHNSGGDQAPQSHFSIEWSNDYGVTWHALTTGVASTTAAYVVPANTLSNGITYQWHVKTEGVVSGGYGPWSSVASMTGSATPTVTLSLPVVATHTVPLIAAWAYNQDQSSPQAEWQAILYAADGVSVLESQASTGAASTTTFVYDLVDQQSYVTTVRARSGAGVWSDWATVTTVFTLLPPAAAILTLTYQECTGEMTLHVEVAAPVGGVTVAVESVALERMVDGGDWVTLAHGLIAPVDFIDPLPLTNGINSYRATTTSATPSNFTGNVVTALGTDGGPSSGLWTLLTFGDGFSTTLRAHGEPKVSGTTGRTSSVQAFLGRPKPVLLMGTNTTRTVTVTASLNFNALCVVVDPDDCTFDSPPVGWSDAGTLAEIVCFRDFTGRRVFGTLSDITVTDANWPGKAAITYTVTETDFTERYV